MIEAGTGDLFATPVDALVNAVNTVGVMGKGLAAAFKKQFPDNYESYRRACRAGVLVPGKVHVFDRLAGSPRWIINFPTKRHFRGASRLEDIRDGLADLMARVEQLGMTSVAIPALGCGLGGLRWDHVQPLIAAACERLPVVRFVVYAPRA